MKFIILTCVLISILDIKAWNPFSFLSKKPILSKTIQTKEIPIKTQEKRKAWYIIGKSDEFEIDKPYSVVLQEKKYVVWKDGTYGVEGTERFYALEDQCSHKGAALSSGFLDQGCIVCPYHFSYFSKDGSLILGNTIMKEGSREVSSDNARKNTSISSFSVLSQNNWIYLNPNPDPDLDLDLDLLIPIYNTSISKQEIETEIETEYQCSAEIIGEKMLDIIHYYQDPNPGPNDMLILQQPRWISNKRTNLLNYDKNDSQVHAQTIYQFRSGIRPISENIFVQKAGRTFFTIVSEFVLPYTFITKIQTGDYTLKIVSCISPISPKRCHVYTKIHRNFGKNLFGEYMVRSFVHTFLEKDRLMLEKIDYESWKQRGERKSRYYYRQEKMIRFYRQAFDGMIG